MPQPQIYWDPSTICSMKHDFKQTTNNNTEPVRISHGSLIPSSSLITSA